MIAGHGLDDVLFGQCKSMIQRYGLKKIADREIEENVLPFYDTMMRRFWGTKDLIP